MARSRRMLSGLPYNLGGYVYIIQCGAYCKVGITTRMGARMTDFRVNNPYDIKLLFFADCRDYKRLEKEIHSEYSTFRHRGEWFTLSDVQIDEIISKIKTYGEKNV